MCVLLGCYFYLNTHCMRIGYTVQPHTVELLGTMMNWIGVEEVATASRLRIASRDLQNTNQRCQSLDQNVQS